MNSGEPASCRSSAIGPNPVDTLTLEEAIGGETHLQGHYSIGRPLQTASRPFGLLLTIIEDSFGDIAYSNLLPYNGVCTEVNSWQPIAWTFGSIPSIAAD